MLAIKYSDGTYYPVWWIVDVLQNTDVPPVGYVSMTEANFDQWIIDNKTAMDNWITENVLIPKAKLEKYSEIDNNTGYLIDKGFTFAGLTFSLSQNAQINWSNILQLPGGIFPLPVMSKDEQVYSLSLENRMNFYLSAVNGKNVPLQSGSVLKTQVKALNDLNEIINFVDTRI